MSKATSHLRIIGGKFKSRKITFPPLPDLRPTPDRVRETLFNWLAYDIVNSNCLDAFAGSGALGFEAISRGAAFVTMVEQSAPGVQQLQATAKQLNITNLKIVRANTLEYLPQIQHQFDIVFLDPPFHHNLLIPLLNLLGKHQILRPQALIYIESPHRLTTSDIPADWECLKSHKAGQVCYSLYRVV